MLTKNKQRGDNSDSTFRKNRFLVLDLIRKCSPVTKTQIAKITGLTSMTINNIINDLYDFGLIREMGIDQSTGGRKPSVYALDAGNKVCLVVDLSSDDIIVSLVDINGNISALNRFNFTPAKDNLILKLINIISNFVIKNVQDRGLQVIGIGIAVPGLIDSKSGVIKLSIPLNWTDVPLKSILEQTFQFPVLASKETHAAIVGEHYFGLAENARDSLYINVGSGVGVGILIDGRIYTGANDMSGELGHIVAVPEGPSCECGNKGCLEKVASLRALALSAKVLAENGESLILAQRLNKKGGDIGTEDLFEAVEMGDDLAKQIVKQGASYLASGILSLERLFNPEVIVIGGNAIEEGKLYCKEILNSLNEFNDYFGKKITVKFSKLGEKARLLGLSILVFNDYLENLLNNYKKEEI